MPSRLSLSLALALALVLALSACAKQDEPAAADAAPAGESAPAAMAATPADSAPADTAGVKLTMDKVDRFLAATRQLAAVEQADASLDSAMNASTEDTAAYAARLEATPALRHAIARAGLSAREYAQTSEALVATLMAIGAQEAGALKDLPAELDPQHIDFVRTHRAELEQKLQAAGALGG